jgi:hypothetical protein
MYLAKLKSFFAAENLPESYYDKIKVKCVHCKELIVASATRCSKCAGDLSTSEIRKKTTAEVQQKSSQMRKAGAFIFVFFILFVIYFSMPADSDSPLVQAAPQVSPYADEFQKTWRENASDMARRNDIKGLRAWAVSLGIKTERNDDAKQLEQAIKEASKDFAIYRDADSANKLMQVLDAAWKAK